MNDEWQGPRMGSCDRMFDSGRIVAFKTVHGYMGIPPSGVFQIANLFEALSLFGDDAVVAWDRDIMQTKLGQDLDVRDVGGVIWPGSEKKVGKIWFGHPDPIFHFDRETLSWREGH